MNFQKAVLTLALGLITFPAFAADYKIDPGHSFVTFRIQHLGYSWTYGQFNTLSGTFSYDAADPASSQITVDIDTTSIDTNHAERDKDVRENWLGTANFSKATFESTQYTGTDTEGVLEGALTLNGVSKPISINVQKVGEGKDPWGGYRAGFLGTIEFARGDWGIPGNLGPQSELMEFEIGIEGVRQ